MLTEHPPEAPPPPSAPKTPRVWVMKRTAVVGALGLIAGIGIGAATLTGRRIVDTTQHESRRQARGKLSATPEGDKRMSGATNSGQTRKGAT